MTSQTKFGLKNRNFPVILSIHHPLGATWSVREVIPGGLDLSTHAGVSKKDPLGPVPANPPGKNCLLDFWFWAISVIKLDWINETKTCFCGFFAYQLLGYLSISSLIYKKFEFYVNYFYSSSLKKSFRFPRLLEGNWNSDSLARCILLSFRLIFTPLASKNGFFVLS